MATDFQFLEGIHIRFINLNRFLHCHNKLIVVDDEKVLVGSQNWSSTAVQLNREASLWLENAAMAAYFGRIFDADWEMSAPTAAEAESFAPAQAFGLETLANGGMLRSTTRDYEEV